MPARTARSWIAVFAVGAGLYAIPLGFGAAKPMATPKPLTPFPPGNPETKKSQPKKSASELLPSPSSEDAEANGSKKDAIKTPRDWMDDSDLGSSKTTNKSALEPLPPPTRRSGTAKPSNGKSTASTSKTSPTDSTNGKATETTASKANVEAPESRTVAPGETVPRTMFFYDPDEDYGGRDRGYIDTVTSWPIPERTRDAKEVRKELEKIVRPSLWRRVLRQNQIRNNVIGVLSHPRWARGEEYGKPEYGFRSVLGDLIGSIDIENSSKRELKKIVDILTSLGQDLAHQGRSGGLLLAMAMPLAEKSGQTKKLMKAARSFMRRYTRKARQSASFFGPSRLSDFSNDYDFMLRWSRLAYWAAAPFPELREELAKRLKGVIRKARADSRFDAWQIFKKPQVPATDDPYELLKEIDTLRADVGEKRRKYKISQQGGWKQWWAQVRKKPAPEEPAAPVDKQYENKLKDVDRLIRKGYRYAATQNLLDAIDLWGQMQGEKDRDIKFATSPLKTRFDTLDDELDALPKELRSRINKVGVHNLAEATLEQLDKKTEKNRRWNLPSAAQKAGVSRRGDPTYDTMMLTPVED